MMNEWTNTKTHSLGFYMVRIKVLCWVHSITLCWGRGWASVPLVISPTATSLFSSKCIRAGLSTIATYLVVSVLGLVFSATATCLLSSKCIRAGLQHHCNLYLVVSAFSDLCVHWLCSSPLLCRLSWWMRIWETLWTLWRPWAKNMTISRSPWLPRRRKSRWLFYITCHVVLVLNYFTCHVVCVLDCFSCHVVCVCWIISFVMFDWLTE